VAVVWITGARGFIGRHAARRAAASGHAVAGLGHGAWPEAAAWGAGDWLNGDVEAANLSALARRTGPPDVVVHLAGGASVGTSFAAPAEDFRRTVGATAALLEWLRLEAPGCRTVLASSAAVYGDGHDGPIPEDARLRPYSPYGHHKAAMELLARSYGQGFGLRLAVVRLFSVCGPELRKQLVWDLSLRLSARPGRVVLGGSGDELRDWLDVADAADLLLRAAEAACAEATTVNGGQGVGTSVRDVARAVLRAWDRDDAPVFDGAARPGDPGRLVADPERARTLLGFAPAVAPLDAVARAAAWCRSVLADGPP
jgi:UDP-glucose 4-epimerase